MCGVWGMGVCGIGVCGIGEWAPACGVWGHRRACSIVFIRPISAVWSASTSEAN